MEFARETLFDVVGEVEPLLQQHYRELAKNQDRVKLNPDWDRYVTLERVGSLHVFTARADGDLVGYSCFFSTVHPHYANVMLVSNDVLWLAPEHRHGRTGVKLMRFCEAQIRQQFLGDVCITWHCKDGTTLSGILARMGYQVQDVVMSKLL